jgi:hypothetical protein
MVDLLKESRATQAAGGLAWLLLVGLIQFFDVFTRYRGGPVNFYLWALFFVVYAVIALRFHRRYGDIKFILACYLLSALFMPAIYALVQSNSTAAAMMMIFNPVWIIYLLLLHAEDFPRLSFLYMIFWIALLTFCFMPQVQNYAQEQGYTATVSPAIAIRYMASASVKAWNSFWTGLAKMQEEVVKETERTYKVITGDYYTGEVDEGSKRALGVFLDPLKSAQPKFYEGQPATVYTSLRAETIAEPLNIRLKCTADKKEADKIIPKSEFRVETLEEQSIDCVFNDLKPKNYDFKLTADFDFTTRAYQKVYFMNKERLRETKRKGIDPLADFSDKLPATVYTNGPVMIGVGGATEQQPVGVEPATGPEPTGPTIGVTIDNIWTGKMTKIHYLILMVPKGLEVTDINGFPVQKIDNCQLLPSDADINVCDDDIVNLYALPDSELTIVNSDKDIIAYTFRAHTKIADYEKLIGDAPLAIDTFKVTVKYDYSYSVSKAIVVDKKRAET